MGYKTASGPQWLAQLDKKNRPFSATRGRRVPLRLRGPGRGGGGAGARELGAGTRKGLRRWAPTEPGAGSAASVRGARVTGVAAALGDPGRRQRRRPEA